MPYFELPYSRVVEDTSGHCVRFVANIPSYVPPVQSLIDKVQMFGGQEVKEPVAKVDSEAETGEADSEAETGGAGEPVAAVKKPRPAARG